ncbi:MAG TPA: hypothetical protein VNN73_19360 [Blastocatellia bacterium]|nr:hypothetical protein [Blastocatellia bacterium]
MQRQIILRLIEDCKRAERDGATLDEICTRVLPDKIIAFLKAIAPQDFLEWIKEDREFSFYYYDAQQAHACAKPAETVAMILEAIVIDALE